LAAASLTARYPAERRRPRSSPRSCGQRPDRLGPASSGAWHLAVWTALPPRGRVASGHVAAGWRLGGPATLAGAVLACHIPRRRGEIVPMLISLHRLSDTRSKGASTIGSPQLHRATADVSDTRGTRGRICNGPRERRIGHCNRRPAASGQLPEQSRHVLKGGPTSSESAAASSACD